MSLAVHAPAPSRAARRPPAQAARVPSAVRSSAVPHASVARGATGCACGGYCPRCSAAPALAVASPHGRLEHDAESRAARTPAISDRRIQAAPSPTRTTKNSQRTASTASPLAHQGSPLAPALRARYESDFGRDFSQVRVHADTRSAAAVRGIGAAAFTVGSDIVVGQPGWSPKSPDGHELLAHELAHVTQHQEGADRQALPGGGPLVQRRLLAQGNPDKIQDFLFFLQPAIAATLMWDAASRRIWMGDNWTVPATSPDARSRLGKIFRDPEVNAEVSISAPKGQSDGAPLDVDTLVALEKVSPNMGINSALDDIEENYETHREAAADDRRRHPSLSLLRPDQLCGPQGCYDEEQADFERKASDRRIDEDHARWRKIAHQPFNDRLQRAHILAPSDATGHSTVDEIWTYGINHDLFLETEEKLVKGTITKERDDKTRKHAKELRRQAETEQYTNWVNQGDALVSDLQLMTIQPFIFGAGAFGWRAAAVYDGFQLGNTAHDVYQAAGPKGSGAIVLSALVIGILLRERPPGIGVEGPPRITMGDVKSIKDYERGLKHISEMEGRGRYNATGNVGMAMYDADTGDVFLQVFGPRSGSGPRTIIWEGKIGRIEVPAGVPPIRLGNILEEPVRQLVGRATKQIFPTKAANAPGPDLHIPLPKP